MPDVDHVVFGEDIDDPMFNVKDKSIYLNLRPDYVYNGDTAEEENKAASAAKLKRDIERILNKEVGSVLKFCSINRQPPGIRRLRSFV